MSLVPIEEIWRRYEPPGPVAKEFLINPQRVSSLVGPYGSGKTTANFMRGLLQSTCVPPSPVDGVRYAKGVVINDTYTNLDKTTIASYKINFPDEWGMWSGGGGGPAISTIRFQLDDGSVLHQEIIFAAIGDTNVKTFTDGFEATWAFLNGVSKLPEDIIKFMYGRLGRWPPPQHRPANWREFVRAHKRLSCDDNAPDISNWSHTYFWKEHRERLFLQPGAMLVLDGPLNPLAENLQNLDPDYYADLIDENSKSGKWWVRRYVMNKVGFSREGDPVYESWDDIRHVSAKPLKFNPLRKLILGLDAGRNPAAIAMQRTPEGALHVLAEFVPGRMGAKLFGKRLSQWLAENFPNADIEGFADPASADPTQDTDDDSQSADEGTWLSTVADVAEITIEPAPSNQWSVRFDAVNSLLMEFVETKPMFLLSCDCPKLQEGFNSGYRYGNTRVHGDKVSTDRPIKNDFSHPHDALQYGALASCDFHALTHRAGKQRRHTVVEVADDY